MKKDVFTVKLPSLTAKHRKNYAFTKKKSLVRSTPEIFSAIILRRKSSNSIEDIMNPSFAHQPNKYLLLEVVGT